MMINKIVVSERRGLFPEYSSLGTIGEKNATTLLFLLPVALQGYSENIVCETAQGSFNYTVSNDTFNLPSEVLTDSTLKLQLVLKDGADKVIWKSVPYTFTLNPTLDDSGENPITKAKAEQREDDRTELGETLSDLTGQDLKKSDWDELIDIANELPLKSKQDVLDLRKCSELTYAFAHATTPPSLITGSYKLDKEDPDNPDSPNVLIKLPFLETPNAVYRFETTRVSQSIEECGFSIGDKAAKEICFNGRSMFNAYGGTVAANLKRITLVGIERVVNSSDMFQGCRSLEEITLIERGNNAEKYSTGYWYEYFKDCSALQSILGTPLDMSHGTDYTRTFQKCSKLKYVRFKPFTISHDLNLSDCSALMKGKYGATSDDPGTLLSIVNGVREYRSELGQITISFSAFVKDYLTSWRCVQDSETGLYVASTQGITLATVLTNNKGVIIA
jgi:hypothetical protein|nr:MAG TPA: hypothetical protein [Caudoviricetes sp.]